MTTITSNRIQIPFVGSRFDHMVITWNNGERSGSMVDCCIMLHQHTCMSRDMRFPTKWNMLPAKSQISLRRRTD